MLLQEVWQIKLTLQYIELTPHLKGLQIHEVHPVKFGGSPTDPANKIYLSPTAHSQYTNFFGIH